MRTWPLGAVDAGRAAGVCVDAACAGGSGVSCEHAQFSASATGRVRANVRIALLVMCGSSMKLPFSYVATDTLSGVREGKTAASQKY